jgi:hypothetical protein
MAIKTWVAGEEVSASDLNTALAYVNPEDNSVKTFTQIPSLPASNPTTDNQATRKAYVDSLRRLKYVEIAPVSKTLGGGEGSAWTDWDLSATIPANALYAEIQCPGGTSLDVGARKNGSAVDRKFSTPGGGTFSPKMTVELDANRVIEVYSSSTGANFPFFCLGYWIQV